MPQATSAKNTEPPRQVRVAFVNLNAGPHGEYGALLAAAVAGQDGVDVLSIIPDSLAASERARTSLGKSGVRAVRTGGALGPLRSALRTLAILRRFRPDIIHEPVGSGIPTILPLRPFMPLIAPVIVTEHNPTRHPGVKGWHHGIARALTRWTASRIHVHGPKAFAEMKELGYPEDRLVKIRHGAFDEYGPAAAQFPRSHPKQILVFGALRPNKGIDMLPQIMRLVQAAHPDATLLITGKRPTHLEAGQGQAMIAALDELANMPGCTVLDARVPESDIPRLFGQCGICLLPYHTATQSGVAMVAMATRAPLVATRVGDIPDIIDDGQTGLLANPDPGSIARCIIAALDDPASTQERAEAAARFAQEECAWPVIGRQMVAAYRDMLA